MDVVTQGPTAPLVALPAVAPRTSGRAERMGGVAPSTPGHRAVRADLEQVFRTSYPRVVAVAGRVLGSREEAEDVAQEVFLAFGRTSVPADDAPGWLSVAAVHTALNHLRTTRRRASREQAAGSDAAGPAREVAPDTADAVVSLDERRRVRAALALLPHKQAAALVLRHSGLSYAEVASALEMSPASVGTTVRRAEQALRKEMDRHAPPD